MTSLYPSPCLSPSHNPPMHLYIPAGEVFVHTCPQCGNKITIKALDIVH